MTSRSFRQVPLILGLALAAAAFSGGRFHARLVKAEPGVDSVVTVAPTRIQLWFNEPVNPRLTSADLLTRDSTPVATVTFARMPDPLSVSAPLTATLTPGLYRVQWRTMSPDGHTIRGEYRFTFTP
jgi:hypothetical protein